MMLDNATAYRALLSRDARFDGHFFVGVRTTGIYCRPVCRVRAPKASSCQWYDSAAAAEVAGFRPCLRCRPERAPGLAPVDSPVALAQAAARMIEAMPDVDSLESIAARLGIGERHLRRIFRAGFGVSPVAWLQTRRLLLAKRLLAETTLPVTEVAAVAGFGSLRRLEALFRERYRMSPASLRRSSDTAPVGALELRLDYRPPLAWGALLDFLARRAVPGVEQVEGGVYRRVVRMGAGGGLVRGWIEVAADPERPQLRLRVDPRLARAIAALIAAVRRQFDLDADPLAIADGLGVLAADEPGLRLPGAIDPFEQAVRAILGQQVSVAAATTLAARLAGRFGEVLEHAPAGLQRCFPDATTLAAQDEDNLRALGILASRARSILALARAHAEDRLALDPLAPVEPTLAALRTLPGFGEWTVQYIALRCLSWPDAFPHTDLIIRRAFPGLSPGRVLAAAERWRPWRGYATLHLWRAS
jgi:AraC family transcriptional regulator, regulatory protein of adaptative response / DNA-3-methyladenine glycosylase II